MNLQGKLDPHLTVIKFNIFYYIYDQKCIIYSNMEKEIEKRIIYSSNAYCRAHPPFVLGLT